MNKLQEEMDKLNEELKKHSFDSPEYIEIMMKQTAIFLELAKYYKINN